MLDMNLTYLALGFMFFASFMAQYFTMSPITTDQLSHVTNSTGKVYLSSIMGLIMVLIMIAFPIYNNPLAKLIAPMVISIIILIVMYRQQIWIDDADYLREMIEHHSMAILTSKQILQKTKNSEVIKLAATILDTQQKEIDQMKTSLSKLENV